jgi:hypothetical protein
MSDSDYTALAAPQGQFGFFSYVFNIDLKNPYADSYYKMPRLSEMPKPSATVLMFDGLFNPVTEKNAATSAGSAAFNSANPAIRYRSIGSRHEIGTVINFCDGHAQYYKQKYLTNSPGWPGTEPLLADVIWDWTAR